MGLLASRLGAAVPAAVQNTTTSLRLAAPASLNAEASTADAKKLDMEIIEVVQDVRSLDVAALLARMVGAIQALDEKVRHSY